jgi:DNA adenine methylase
LTAEPFLRWPGGKRWLARRIALMIRARLAGTYREPFLGAGGMFFAVEPSRAALSDINGELINAWREAAENPDCLLSEIRRIPVDAATYSRIRAHKPLSPLQRAIRFIYLNRCCYGGLYRTNRKGDFNVPYGGGSRTPAPLWERAQLARANGVLVSCDFTLDQQDFAAAIAHAVAGDICFLDPTYTAIRRGPFDRYNVKLFTWSDQIRLHATAEAVAKRGAIVIICNVDCAEVRALYRGQLAIPLGRPKAIGNAIKNSRAQHELLIVYDSPEWHDSWVSFATQTPLSKVRTRSNPQDYDAPLVYATGALINRTRSQVDLLPLERVGASPVARSGFRRPQASASAD